jgi:hypothetical protein
MACVLALVLVACGGSAGREDMSTEPDTSLTADAGTEAGTDSGEEASAPCPVATFGCQGANVTECEDNGQWKVIANCPAGCTGAGDCNCVEGSLGCAGDRGGLKDEVVQCVDGGSVVIEVCPHACAYGVCY